MEALTLTKDVSIIVAGVVALTTFLSGFLEYARQGHQRRAEHLLALRRRFLETPLFREISNLLQADDEGLRQLPRQDRRNYVGFLEEIAIMVNSRLLRREVAHAMFGHYVRLVSESENFWDGLDRQGIYWKVFRAFAEDMAKLDGEATPLPARLRI